jgi:hypothetical protein
MSTLQAVAKLFIRQMRHCEPSTGGGSGKGDDRCRVFVAMGGGVHWG